LTDVSEVLTASIIGAVREQSAKKLGQIKEKVGQGRSFSEKHLCYTAIGRVIRENKSRRIKLAGHVAGIGQMINSQNIAVG
jgi:hypothetical protein